MAWPSLKNANGLSCCRNVRNQPRRRAKEAPGGLYRSVTSQAPALCCSREFRPRRGPQRQGLSQQEPRYHEPPQSSPPLHRSCDASPPQLLHHPPLHPPSPSPPSPPPHLFLLHLLPLALAQNINVYQFPVCAQTCALDIYPTGCLRPQTNDSCICADTPYLNTIAHCIGLSCDAAGLAASADVFLADCAASGASFAMSKAQFVATGDGDGGAVASSALAPASSGFVTSTVKAPVAASSSTVDGATRTSAAPVPAGTGIGAGTGGGFTLDQKIALGCGIGIGLPGTLAAIVTCLRVR
jgi:hypothetical protein